MQVKDFGQHRGVNYHPTPPYGVFDKEKQDKQSYQTFIKKGEGFPDSQTLMGGPKYKAIESLSKEMRAAYGGEIESGKLWSEGRYHQ